MRGILFAFLRVFGWFRRAGLKIRGISEDNVSEKRVVSGKAWDEFCDNLKLAGNALIYPSAPRDPFQQAEGLRYLTRLTRAGLEAFVEYNDPTFPVFRRMVHETVKMGADNPDNHYYNAQVSGKYEYRITGKRNTIHFLGFYTQNGNYGTTGGLAPCGKLDASDMEIDKDGTFEIILSKKPKGKNWLKIEEETTLVMVRQTFLDSDREEPAEFTIENLDGRKHPDPVTPVKVDEGLKTASMFVAGAPLLFAKWAKGFQKHTNKLPLFEPEVSNAAGGDSSIIYHHSHWKLYEDEALVIRVSPPECDSWNFQLNNYWMESLDYRYFNICINKSNAVYNKDGSVTVVVAHSDPGMPNWIDTCSHHEGTMCWRWYRLAEGESPAVPQCEVVKTDKLVNGEK